jgi:nucleotide-binding universal stress UspA family protein
MKTKILIPVDGSKFSEQIAPYVVNMFGPEDAEIFLLRVTEPVHSRTAAQAEVAREAMSLGMATRPLSGAEFDAALHPIYANQIEMNVRAELESGLLELERSLKQVGFTVTTVVDFGDAAATILHFVEREQIDLIAMTTHGRTGLRRVLFGSVAEEILRKVGKPILLLRPNEL